MNEQATLLKKVNYNKRMIRNTRRTFSKAFKIKCVQEVLAGAKTTQDFTGRDGRPIYYGNVEVWVNEYLAGKWGKPKGIPVIQKIAVEKPRQEAPVPMFSDSDGTDFREIAYALAAAIRKTTDLEIENEKLRARRIAASAPQYVRGSKYEGKQAL